MALEKDQSRNLALDLRQLFEKWQSVREGRTEAQLARKSGLADQKVRRMLEGAARVSLEELEPVLMVIATPLECFEIYKKYYPGPAESISRIYNHFDNKQTPDRKFTTTIEKDIRDQFNDPLFCELATYIWANSKEGVGFDDIGLKYGEKGDMLATQMIDQELVERNSTGKLFIPFNNIAFDKNTRLQIAANLANYFKVKKKYYVEQRIAGSNVKLFKNWKVGLMILALG